MTLFSDTVTTPTRAPLNAEELPGPAALAEWAKQNAGTHQLAFHCPSEHGGPRIEIPMLAVPSGYVLHSLKAEAEKYRTAPERIKGSAAFTRPDSFIAHVRRFGRAETSVIFVDKRATTVTAIYDYHAPEAPAYCCHRAVCAFERSQELNAWIKVSGQEMSQENFAAFVEHHLPSVIDPSVIDPASRTNDPFRFAGLRAGSQSSLTSLARNLFVRVETTVIEVRRQETGETKMIYEQATKGSDGGPLVVPAGFFVGIPLVDGDETASPLAVRLSMRLKDGKVFWTVQVHRAAEVFESCFATSVEIIAQDTHLPVFWGTPEK